MDPPRSPRLHRSNAALAGFARVVAGSACCPARSDCSTSECSGLAARSTRKKTDTSALPRSPRPMSQLRRTRGLRLRRQGGRSSRPCRRGSLLHRDRGCPETTARRRRASACVPGEAGVAPGPRPTHKRALEEPDGRLVQRQEPPNLERHAPGSGGVGPVHRGSCQRPRSPAGDPTSHDGCVRRAGKYARRRPGVLHRSARVRSFRIWLDDRRRAAPHREPGPRAGGASGRYRAGDA